MKKIGLKETLKNEIIEQLKDFTEGKTHVEYYEIESMIELMSCDVVSYISDLIYYTDIIKTWWEPHNIEIMEEYFNIVSEIGGTPNVENIEGVVLYVISYILPTIEINLDQFVKNEEIA